jgi:hypothetical protein
MRKFFLAVVLTIALFGSALGAATTFGTQSRATHIHVMADVTPAVICGGGGSGYCK